MTLEPYQVVCKRVSLIKIRVQEFRFGFKDLKMMQLELELFHYVYCSGASVDS